jgi:hypothetical protein
MCTALTEEAFVTKRAITMYKPVAVDPSPRPFQPSRYVSEYQPHQRKVVGRYKTRGQRLVYTVGATVVSPSGPGIMGFANWQEAVTRTVHVLTLRIPAGTRVVPLVGPCATNNYLHARNGYAAARVVVVEASNWEDLATREKKKAAAKRKAKARK